MEEIDKLNADGAANLSSLARVNYDHFKQIEQAYTMPDANTVMFSMAA